MKTKLIIVAFTFLWACSSVAREVVNEVRAIIYHKDGSAKLILTSDVKSDMNGAPRSIRDIIVRQLQIEDARSLHITVSKDEIEAYLASLQKANRMTRADLEKLMENMGFTYEEGAEELLGRQMAEQAIDQRIKSDKRFIIQREEVEAFDTKNPAYEEACYTLCQVCVPTEKAPKDSDAKALDALPWEEPFEIKESQLSEDKFFIANEPLGIIVDRDEVDEGVELTRLVDKKLRKKIEVDQRYDQIVNIIRMQRFEELMREYEQELLSKATIRFTYPEDKKIVMATL